MEFDKWIEQGERLGLKGKTLMAFVKEQQVVAKEEKAHEREEKQAEREERKEAKREERKEEAKHGERTRDAKSIKEEMGMTIDLGRIQLEIETATRAHITRDTGDVRVMVNKPKLPTYDEKRNELDAYLERFEHFAARQHWNREDCTVSLSPLLTGKALQVYVHQYAVGECSRL